MLEGEPQNPIPIFSNDDIETFLEMVLTAHDNNHPVGEVYAGVMSSGLGHLQLHFTGNPLDITNIPVSALGINGQEAYDAAMNNNTSYEGGLLDFIKNTLKVEGLELHRLNEDGTSTKLEIDPNDASKLKETPCN